MKITILVCCMLLAPLSAVDDLLPKAPTTGLECHGILAGERFWARLTLPKKEFGNQRVLELVYTPARPHLLGGANLSDCPYLLFDDRLRLTAWNDRDTLSRAVANARGYLVSSEVDIQTPDGQGTSAGVRDVAVSGPHGWDERVAPILLALTWQSGSRGEVPCYDLYATAPIQSAVSWQDTHVVIAGRNFRAQADSLGRLARLGDSNAAPTLTISSWIAPAPP